MASSLLVMSDIGSSGLSASSAAAPSSCSASRPIAATRRAANNIDFSAYLLSTSPPGFELSPGVFTCGLPPSQRVLASNPYQVHVSAPVAPSGVQAWGWSRTSSASSLSSRLVDASDGDASPARSSSLGSRPGSNGQGAGFTKKVSFADDLGMLLEQICFFHESSDTPPNLSPRLLRRYASVDNLVIATAGHGRSRLLKRSLSATQTSSLQQERPPDEVVTIPRLIANFPMPVADRSAYLDRIECACVSLESVRVLPVETRSGTSNGPPPVIDRLVGSVAVRNVAFDKAVTVRCTFDGWVSYVDVRAVYARSERVVRRPAGSLEFDVFEFSVNLPVRWRAVRSDRPRVELAVRYDVDHKTFWDNNDGQNYELVGALNASRLSRRHRDDDDDDSGTPCWTEFSGWNNVDTTCPYW